MNTANLQLEGLYTAVAALMSALREKGLLNAQEIDEALARAEQVTLSSATRARNLSDSNVDAVRFPLRYLRLANQTASEGRALDFQSLARLVGETKRD